MLEIIHTIIVRKEIVSLVKKFWNIDISNFSHTIDSTGINHVYKRHGLESNEIKDQIITKDDIALILEIIQNPDEIVAGGLSGKRKLPTIMYIKYTATHKYYYVEEILNGKKELRIKTMFKNLKK